MAFAVVARNEPVTPADRARAVAPSGGVPQSVRAFVADKLLTLHETGRYQRLAGWAAYYDGRQFEGRTFDEHGCYPGSMGLAGGPEGFAGWQHRRVRSVNNLALDIVEQLTQWSVVGTSWCSLRTPGDEAATEWLEGIAKESYFQHATAEVVATAGGCGSAVVSGSWRQDRVAWEVHRPEQCWPLSWVEPRDLVPLEVVKVFRQPDPYAPARARPQRPEEGPWTLRYWSGRGPAGEPGIEAYYLAYRDTKGFWVIDPQGPAVAHGSERCPVFWVPRGTTREERGFDGEPFFAGAEGLIDASNELEQAGDNTSKRNADDTIVVKDKAENAPKVLRKGSLGAIFAPGGAEYLSQKGDSAKVLYELGERREAQAYRQAHVIKVDVETLSRQTTGESLKRLYFTMLNEADDVRTWAERYFVRPATEWMLAMSRDMAARGVPVSMPPVEDDADPGEGGKPGKPVVRARKPGSSSYVVVTWPQAFPPTIDDLKTASEAVKNATGGTQIISRETGIATMVRAGASVEGGVEAEVERLRAEADEKAENTAKGIGLATKAEADNAPEPKAGDIEADPEADDKSKAGATDE